jgi:hypothetical protein
MMHGTMTGTVARHGRMLLTSCHTPSASGSPLACQGSSAPFAFLSAPGASSGQTSVHAVGEPWLPFEKLSADDPGAAKPQCALKGGRHLWHASVACIGCAQGAIRQAEYGSRLSGERPNLGLHGGCVSHLIFQLASLQAMQLIPADCRAPFSIHVMAAFERDGVLVPLQQPVDLKARSDIPSQVRLIGWPGRSTVCRNARITGCYRWLPQGVAAPGHPPATGVSAGAGAASRRPSATRAGAGSGTGSGPGLAIQPGLLVIQVESVQQGGSSDEGGTTADEGEEGSGAEADEEEQGEVGKEVEVGARQGEDIPDNDLAAAGAQAALSWHPHSPRVLLLQLPYKLARRCSAVALELGSVLLPSWVTGNLVLRPQGDGSLSSLVVVRKELAEFMSGAELLPCKAVPSATGATGQQTLVLRAAWPPAPPGQLVGASPLHVPSNLCMSV